MDGMTPREREKKTTSNQLDVNLDDSGKLKK